jgi:hypothetical protein
MTTRRLKTYTAQTGLVYQYYFVGQRATLASDPEAPATEYVFDVTSDRKTLFAVSVFLGPQAMDTWASAYGRNLTDPERYAAVKLRLMQAFDEISDMLQSGRRLKVEPSEICNLLASLGID